MADKVDETAQSDDKNCEENRLSAYVPTSAILDGVFFTVVNVSEDGSKVKARCNNCTVKTFISGSRTVLSNFTTHLKVSLFILPQYR